MSGFVSGGIVLVLSFILGKVADFTASGVRRLSMRFHVNEFITAFFLLAVATSIPEMAVAVVSALHGVPQLSFGNLIGANIVVLSLMLGSAAVFSGKLSIHKALHKDDFFLTLIMVGLPIPFFVNGHISRTEGLLMMIAYGYFLLHFFWRRRAYRRTSDEARISKRTMRQDIAIFFISVVALLVISYVLVHISLQAAAAIGVPILVVGLLMIAVGTNVPEVTFVLKQARRRDAKDKHIAMGVLLGSVVFNTPTLGLLAFIQPFSISDIRAVWVTAAMLVTVLYAIWIFVLSGKKLSRREGGMLILLYLLFVGYQLGLFTRFF